MIRVDVKDLKGDEILAVPVMSASDTVKNKRIRISK